MRLTSRDKELIVLALSLGIVAASWFGGARFINKKTAEIEAERDLLQAEYDDRKSILDRKDEYLKDTKDYNDAYSLMMTRYPGGISTVRQIMFVVGLEERFGLQVLSVDYTDGEPIYEFQSVEPKNQMPYSFISGTIQIPVLIEYDQWKEFLDYVFSYEDKSTVPEVSARFDAALGKVDAVVTFRQFAITGEGRKAEEPKVTVPLGTDNIFTSGAELSYNGTQAEQIEAIKKNFACYVMLYPSASDVKAKVIAGADESEKAVSESNEEETLTILAEESDGQCSITYALGGGRPHVQYGLTGDTLDLYVLSSPRMGEADLSGVRVSIDNQTSKKLRIAVSGDDRMRPRFVVEQQTGNVEILKQ